MEFDETEFSEMLRWAAILTSEQDSSFPYKLGPTVHRLQTQLEAIGGQLLLVLGMQGIGKTRLRLYLAEKLEAKTLKLTDLDTLIQMFLQTNDDTENGEAVRNWLIKRFDHPIAFKTPAMEEIGRSVKLKKQTSADIIAWLNEPHISGRYRKVRKILLKVWPKIKDVEEQDRIASVMDTEHILIDFQDYDRTRKFDRNKDLSIIQRLWEAMLSVGSDMPNIVIFWQEELFKIDDHFFWQKFDQWRIEPEKPESMKDYFLSSLSCCIL